MGVEIERKFLVLGDSWRAGDPTEMRQGYLSRDGATVRVRREGARGVLTLKGPSEGLKRAEYEYEIPAGDADELLGLCLDPPIYKTRYRVAHAGKTWEVDEFHGTSAGLVVAEVELLHEDEQVELPEWIDREVSDDPRYRNSHIAAVPYSTWDRDGDQNRG